jgi:type IV secretion system protein VirD4
MYKAARAALMISVLEFGYAFGVAALAGWPYSMFAAIGVVIVRRIKKGRFFWAHGTSRFATERDLRKGGMIDGDKGLMIGRLEGASPTWQEVTPTLFDARVESKAASTQFLRVLGSRKKGRLVRLSKAVHTAVFAPTGVGKGTALIIPWLLECDESAVVIDFKGENASITAKHRRKRFGHHVELLDPWHVVTKKPATLNPVDFILKDSAEVIDDARDLAEQLVVKSGEEKEPHWNEAAEMWISGAVAAVAHHALENRSLQSVCDVLSNPAKVPQLIELLCKSDGMLPRLGGQLAHFQDKELASTLTSASRHLRFLSTPAVAESTSSSSFDPSELRKGKMTVYLIIPPEHMRAAAGLMRVWIGTLMRSVVRGGLQHA